MCSNTKLRFYSPEFQCVKMRLMRFVLLLPVDKLRHQGLQKASNAIETFGYPYETPGAGEDLRSL